MGYDQVVCVFVPTAAQVALHSMRKIADLTIVIRNGCSLPIDENVMALTKVFASFFGGTTTTHHTSITVLLITSVLLLLTLSHNRFVRIQFLALILDAHPQPDFLFGLMIRLQYCVTISNFEKNFYLSYLRSDLTHIC